ncbi:cation diffusion facilitator family transporter [Holophaga foetida]|uniref:cation diffusion facilitator family transporter n=1 Tax=Holophaga foetida TaxID=35839 RepID=UPI00024745FB|nr:cation diffusion facilitator family transporter [Holophaga foetida]
MSASSSKALALSLGANLGIAISKFLVFGLTRSASMLTEAIHSSADCGNQALLFLGMKQAQKPPTAKHPLGQGQAAFVASFLVALLLFSVGGIFSVVEGIHKIRHPETPHGLWWAVGLLVFAMFLEGASLLGAMNACRAERGKKGLFRYLQESSATELVVVLAEDIAAMAGLALALVAVILTMVTGNPIWDGIGSLGIGLILIAVAIFVGVEVTSLLLNEAAPTRLRQSIRLEILEDVQVDRVLNLVTVVVGSDQLMVALKLRFKDQVTGEALIAASNALEARLKARFPQIRFLFVEPDLS